MVNNSASSSSHSKTKQVVFTLLKVTKTVFVILIVLIASLALLAIISHQSLPDNQQRTISTSLPFNPQSALAQQLLPDIEAHPQQSGLYLLDDSHEAFLARLALASSAEDTLDVQYYIWHDDTTGHLLMQSLYQAAERGVRVRLLLDDNNTGGMDALLASVNAHPNIEVRLFNPFMQRRLRPLGYLSDFFRLNRRMHNKSFTADGLVTIAGGRNVGDEYFGFGSGVMFADLDMAAVGPAAQQVEQDFDRYWASDSSYPAENIISINNPEPFDTQPATDEETQQFLTELIHSKFVTQLKSGELPLIWTNTELISDDPAKGLSKPKQSDSVLAHIAPLMTQTKEELLVISPYFVPTQKGTQLFADLADQGKQVGILTNSLAATDVIPVHAGYAKYRKPLLNAGIELYELKPMATISTKDHGGIIKSSGASLHAKTFIIDSNTLFVGSFNMDPRSAALNTEMGFVFDSPEIANYLVDNMKQKQMQYSYAVTKTAEGKLYWQTEEDGDIIEFNNEPHSSWLSRFGVWVCSLLPIEWLL
ncbi:phospholipase D family protein [Psychrobacter sp. FDAARGOS_221]|uniref:phospholipase D family protein n=1 Tax=Psychrobacter sp. FDAARGOS_221 TaxID=1975705 RepID=UPI000BB596F1|nr:phospholipase D family protein [Psychrobacter sp. FDAARGOS_221]PNK60703.1 phospholipase D family protein [Psychrobacter sp. FDAARGOS_221]